jgi:acetoacetate decarboxylase
MSEPKAPKTNPGDIAGWPSLVIDYPTDPDRVAAVLPPGIDPGAGSTVHLSIYCVPVPDEPEYGVVIGVDADYRGTRGVYTLGYGIDQESAIFISRDMNGQPKHPAEVSFYRLGDAVRARCSHQGYTFLEFAGRVGGVLENGPAEELNEWWVKVSRAVGGAEKSYDFPPHVVRDRSEVQNVYLEEVQGSLRLRESPWDPIAERLPVRGQVSARLRTRRHLSRSITLEGALDPDAFWPHADTIGGSRWLGTRGGPRRER